tara:strand:- start:149 stop:601 length:453 start_codon:yes stop_codon:yes gene_type:complete
MSSKSSSSKRNIQSLNTYVKIYHDAARRAAEERDYRILDKAKDELINCCNNLGKKYYDLNKKRITLERMSQAEGGVEKYKKGEIQEAKKELAIIKKEIKKLLNPKTSSGNFGKIISLLTSKPKTPKRTNSTRRALQRRTRFGGRKTHRKH